MKKRKVVKAKKKTNRTQSKLSYGLSAGKKTIYGIEQDFILIAGGSFVLIILGMAILFR